MHERLQARAEHAEHAGAEVSLERRDDEVLEQVRDEIRGDRVEADHDEREGPAPIAARFDDPAEGGEQQEAGAAAVERPGSASRCV